MLESFNFFFFFTTAINYKHLFFTFLTLLPKINYYTFQENGMAYRTRVRKGKRT